MTLPHQICMQILESLKANSSEGEGERCEATDGNLLQKAGQVVTLSRESVVFSTHWSVPYLFSVLVCLGGLSRSVVSLLILFLFLCRCKQLFWMAES